MEPTFMDNTELAGLKANWGTISESRQELVAALVAAGQAHLFAGWDEPGTNDEAKAAFLDSLVKINGNYPGGLSGYIANARKLLAESKAGANPFEGLTPEQPEKVDLTSFSEAFEQYEAIGAGKFDKVGVVLVAGGLGERLGYNGIKLDIAVEVLEQTSYLKHYADNLLAMQARSASKRPVPFIIMVSQDTGPKTIESLEANHYFGLRKEQVHILQQELVPAIADNDGALALESAYQLILKPHGHGDIHMLLHTSGVAAKLAAEGIEYFMFIQDTNGPSFNTLPAAIGVSVEHGYDFNSLAIRRKPGEAVGGLARLVGEGREFTLNVEYNQLDPLLRATINPEGDVADETGFSPFPGNCNTLVIKVDSYVRILEASQGIIAEFVNPKYSDETKTAFKKPTRLETMMQDLPKLFGEAEKVGVTIFDRMWSFSPNKNNVADAAAKIASGGPADASATAENDFYGAGRARLEVAGMKVEEAGEKMILGVPFTLGPKVILRPSFAMTLAEGREKVAGGSISGEATLILEGADIKLENVELSGTTGLVVKACEGAKVTVKGKFENEGFELVELGADADVPEYLKIRGYRFENRGAAIFEFDEPGEYTVQP
ncbi:putative uridylyltransferase [Pontiella desulfatans]|uniref:UTP-monosaccharide-1-phosphate uridylyltransferase n=1 Tax=Pontiella desulfatans TaxID=2750659 RepID=A0A6C2U7I2_PONDE|nr:UTP--glucose-1-phosphate uridylyltransferase [Pontiella desulfatans]VGO15366.1 putative uridylyltransferase [Pontiella desulfatans]